VAHHLQLGGDAKHQRVSQAVHVGMHMGVDETGHQGCAMCVYDRCAGWRLATQCLDVRPVDHHGVGVDDAVAVEDPYVGDGGNSIHCFVTHSCRLGLSFDRILPKAHTSLSHSVLCDTMYCTIRCIVVFCDQWADLHTYLHSFTFYEPKSLKTKPIRNTRRALKTSSPSQSAITSAVPEVNYRVMRKRLITSTPQEAPRLDGGWLDLDRVAVVEVTSEEKEYPVESALVSGEMGGWRAADFGTQTIRLVFDQPRRLTRIALVFEETEAQRTQEFVLRWSGDGGRSFREIVRQQWNFSSPKTTREVEEYQVELSEVTVLELIIVPDISRGAARASLKSLRLS
jgi:hypothetical protein